MGTVGRGSQADLGTVVTVYGVPRQVDSSLQLHPAANTVGQSCLSAVRNLKKTKFWEKTIQVASLK